MFVATGGLKTTQGFVENHGNTNLNFHLLPELHLPPILNFDSEN